MRLRMDGSCMIMEEDGDLLDLAIESIYEKAMADCWVDRWNWIEGIGQW